jgi:signal transduction histidine kinase
MALGSPWQTFVRLLAEQLPAILWSTDAQLVLTSIKGKCLPPNAPHQVGTNLFELTASADRDLMPLATHLRVLQGDSVPYRATWQGRVFLAHVEPLCGPGGSIAGCNGMALEITERQSLQEHLHHVQKRMEMIGALAGEVAHDLNNLLTIVTGYGEILVDKLGAPTFRRELSRELQQTGAAATSLIRQLQGLCRERGPERRPVDLNGLVTDLEQVLSRLVGTGIRLSCVLEPGLTRIQADPGQIEQILLDLAVNARRNMPGGGQLTIETANVELDQAVLTTHPGLSPGRHVLLSVTDTGPADAAPPAAEPAGGPAAAFASMVGECGGSIYTYTEPGQGTAFKIYFPAHDDFLPRTKVRPGASLPPRGEETILLADDEDGVRAIACHVLQQHGYTVLEARHGEEAIRIAEREQGPIDLLVSDVVMAKVGGRQVAERLTAVRPNLKVLYLSGYPDDAIVRHGILAADTNFLQKPFSPVSLALKVREVLDQ